MRRSPWGGPVELAQPLAVPVDQAVQAVDGLAEQAYNRRGDYPSLLYEGASGGERRWPR
jgi:hypothetical protein